VFEEHVAPARGERIALLSRRLVEISEQKQLETVEGSPIEIGDLHSLDRPRTRVDQRGVRLLGSSGIMTSRIADGIDEIVGDE